MGGFPWREKWKFHFLIVALLCRIMLTYVGDKPLLSVLLYKESYLAWREGRAWNGGRGWSGAEAGAEAETEMCLLHADFAGGRWYSSTWPATVRIKLGVNPFTPNILLSFLSHQIQNELSQGWNSPQRRHLTIPHICLFCVSAHVALRSRNTFPNYIFLYSTHPSITSNTLLLLGSLHRS